MRIRKIKLDSGLILPIVVVLGLSFVAFASLEQTIGRSSEAVREIARGAQRAIVRSALTVIAVIGTARLALGIVGGPIMWAVTLGAWGLSGGWDIVAGEIGLPTVQGLSSRIRGVFRGSGGECPPGTIRMASGHCGLIRIEG